MAQAKKTKTKTNIVRLKASCFAGVRFNRPAGFDDLHLAALAEVNNGRGGQAISDQDVNLGQMCDSHRGGARELAAVGNQHDLACVLDDGARYFHLADIEVQQRSAGVDSRSSDHCDIDAELFNLRHGDGADDAAVAMADRAASEENVDRLVAIKLAGDVQIVGDDQQPRMAGKRFGDFL